MALNIFPRRDKTPDEINEPAAPLPEPSPEALAEAESGPAKRPTRRGTRGGRGRGKTATAEPTTDSELDSAASPEPASDEPAPAPRQRASRSRATTATGDDAPARAPARASSRSTTRDGDAPARATRRKPTATTLVPGEENGGSTRIPLPVPADPTLVALARAVEQQSRQLERVMQLQEDLAKRGPGGGGSAARLARVGVFVDVANIELAAERIRTRLDWGRILSMLTRDRELVRAIAYSPVHDDPAVSIETQRFVEPFLDHGYKIVTKPLKRFADGTVKANVDIELALDVITMLDRLDVVCLVSGDGDFQRLVEVIQARGIRVEVIGFGTSTAHNLRHAADYYIDLQSRLKDIRR